MELITLEYEGINIPCPIEHGHRMVPVRHVCDALQVKFTNQDTWLKDHPYYSHVYLLTGTRDSQNRTAEMRCLPMFDLLAWVSSIGIHNRSDESVARQYAFMAFFRAKMLEEYQQITVVERSLDQERELLKANEAELEIISQLKADIKQRESKVKQREQRIEAIRFNRVTGQISMDLLDAPV